MFERDFSLEEKNSMLKDAVIMLLLLMAAFWVNAGIRISGLYMDDLYMWSCYGEQSFIEYVFPIGSTRFRPVYWFAAWLELGIIGNRITWVVPFNIIFSAVIASFLYLFAKRLSASRPVGFIAGIMFICSRFSYYDISQLLGLMEAMCLLFLLIILYNMYICIIQKEYTKNFGKAVICYLFICFTHERYMVLLPMFFYILFVKKERKIRLWFAPVAVFTLVQIVRLMSTGGVMPAGTGSTFVKDTFNIKDFIKNIFSEILYILGVNAGPEHLNGVTWNDTDFFIKLFVCCAIGVLFIILIIYISNQISLILHQKALGNSLYTTLLFFGVMAGCIVASAVTIRVEMRWVYHPYMTALLWLSHMYGTIKKEKNTDIAKEILSMDIDIKQYLPFILVFIWMVLMVPVELYGHSKYSGIYLFPDQKRYNTLADVTYGKYGSDIFGKKIYIIGNYYKMSKFNADTFFKVFDPKRKAEGTEVEFVESYRDFGQVTSNMLVIKEDAAQNAFVDVTDMIRNVKCEAIEGYYTDGWMDEQAEVNIMAGKDGLIDIEFMYPGELEGNETVYMTVDDNMTIELKLENNVSHQKFEVKPYEIINLKVYNNFYLKDAQEKRGSGNLSLLVNIKAD